MFFSRGTTVIERIAPASVRAAVEPLESRRLLSATLLKDLLPGPTGSTVPAYATTPAWAPAEVNGRVVFPATDAGATDGPPRGPVQQADVWARTGRHWERSSSWTSHRRGNSRPSGASSP